MGNYIAKKPHADGFIEFTAEENETWKLLIERQMQVIQNRACDEYIDGLKKLNMPHDHIPQCDEITKVLNECTGWSVVPVEAIIPLEDFFSLLANKKFPAASFIRTREELDYLKEPDIFHEYFGHCPLLTSKPYADFVQWYGEVALRASRKAQSLLGRLFWFSIEFGLINTSKGLRIYGGGILSSFEETVYALESSVPQRLPFDPIKMLQTSYHYYEIQNTYFVINNLNDLFQIRSEKILSTVESLVKEIPEPDLVMY